MTWAIRSFALAAGTAALLSTQAVYAAPPSTTPAVDPLVSLSALGTAQSRAAVCGAGASCALPTTMSAATSATSPVVPATAATAAAMQGDPGKRIDPLLIGVGLLIFIGLIVLLLDGDDGEGDLGPISPA